MKKMTEHIQKRYQFILKGVNTEKVEQRFSISIMSNINTLVDKIPTNVTKLSDLKTINTFISFLDEAKKSHKCVVSMIDFSNKNEFSSENYCRKLGYNCFWCRNNIPQNIIPIGCPIKYVPNQAVKTYYSDISNDEYTIKENITKNKLKKITDSKDNRIKIIDKDYYITDGIFCSFNCCYAYIAENKRNPLYNISETLLLRMYNTIYSDKITSIDSAPSWRKLKEYGGDMTIDEFRSSLGKIEYKEYGFVCEFIKFKPIGVLYEEKLKF